MALEIARIDIRPGQWDAFEMAASCAVPLFELAAGCRSMRLLKSHEDDHRYWLLVDWDDIAAHLAFRETEAFGQWRALVGPFFAGPPVVEHGLVSGIGFGGSAG